MATTVIELPDENMRELEPYREKFGELLMLGLSQLKIQEALYLYQRAEVSLGRAAEIAGVEKPEMIRQARAAGIKPAWSAQMVEDELR